MGAGGYVWGKRDLPRLCGATQAWQVTPSVGRRPMAASRAGGSTGDGCRLELGGQVRFGDPAGFGEDATVFQDVAMLKPAEMLKHFRSGTYRCDSLILLSSLSNEKRDVSGPADFTQRMQSTISMFRSEKRLRARISSCRSWFAIPL